MIQQLVSGDPGRMDDEELGARLLACEAARRKVDAAEAELLGMWGPRQGWAVDGATSGAAWLRHRTGISHATARERLRTAQSLRSMPGTYAALAAGELSFEKARLLAGTCTVNEEAFARDEAFLVEAARRFCCDDLRRSSPTGSTVPIRTAPQ